VSPQLRAIALDRGGVTLTGSLAAWRAARRRCAASTGVARQGNVAAAAVWFLSWRAGDITVADTISITVPIALSAELGHDPGAETKTRRHPVLAFVSI
jgi:hypothetical protein